MPVIADDLFAGAGGWDLAAGTLGVQARGVELHPDPRATREAAGLVTVHDDVWTYTPDGQAQGLIASPPCQMFSKGGKTSGRRALTDVTQALAYGVHDSKVSLRGLARAVGDERAALVLLPIHYATQHGHYRWLAWEQVPAVLPVWEACAALLRELGWQVWAGLLRAEQYGVPQSRTRAVLLGTQTNVAEPPLPTHSRYYQQTPAKLDEGVRRWVCMAEALPQHQDALVGFPRRLDPGQEGVTLDGVAYRARDLRHTSGPAFTLTSKGRSWRTWDAITTRDTDQPAPAMDGTRMRWMPAPVGERPRHAGVPLTVAEAGVLQGFPATFPWRGTRTAQFAQVGNAIPPPMAAAALARVCPQAADHANTDDREGAA